MTHGQLPANYHEIAEKLTGKPLEAYVNSLSREDLIKWLSWNDPNGIYSDEQSRYELGTIITLEEGREIMIRQISDNQ